jgi:hypothetical protein
MFRIYQSAWKTGGVILLMLARASVTHAQAQTEFDRVGLQPNRDYLALQPFEHLDTQSGNVIITLPMLTLPGNAGQDLDFQLTYNANILNIDQPAWSFGITGVPMLVRNQSNPQPGVTISDTILYTRGITPVFVMADGAERTTMFRDEPDISNPSTTRWLMSSDLWKYDRDARILYMPDGTTCAYDPASGRLFEILDIHGNRVTFDWSSVPDHLTVVQTLGNSAPRTIAFVMNAWSLPTTMTFDDRSWQYLYSDNGFELLEATPPGPHGPDSKWMFTYDTPFPTARRLRTLTTPQGGTIIYTYDKLLLSSPNDFRVLLHDRQTGNPQGAAGTWIFTYAYLSDCECSMQTTITTPSAQLIYAYGRVDVDDADLLISGGIALTNLRVRDNDGNEVEYEERHYQQVPLISHGDGIHFDGPELRSRTVWHDPLHTRSYTTEYAYSTTNFGDYHHPNRITETGDLSRLTLLTYTHPRTDTPFLVGLPASQTIVVDDEGWARCWTFDNATGFKTRETGFGTTCSSALATTFTNDGFGNVASTTKASGKTTSFTYSYGQVKDTHTPEYTITR